MMRGEMSVLSKIDRNTDSKTRKARKVIGKMTSANDIASIKERLKQRMQVKAQRERRFDKRNKFYRQNRIFQTDAKQFYREIGKNQVMVKETPAKDNIEKFYESNIEKFYEDNIEKFYGKNKKLALCLQAG